MLQSQLVEDFRTLRKTAEDMNLFRASPLFFSLYLGHILAMELLAWLMVSYFGTSWITTLILACILTTSQVTETFLTIPTCPPSPLLSCLALIPNSFLTI